jgi:hypothetical protein
MNHSCFAVSYRGRASDSEVLRDYVKRGCRDLIALRQELESALATVR